MLAASCVCPSVSSNSWRKIERIFMKFNIVKLRSQSTHFSLGYNPTITSTLHEIFTGFCARDFRESPPDNCHETTWDIRVITSAPSQAGARNPLRSKGNWSQKTLASGKGQRLCLYAKTATIVT
jgi:hypothetical protein